MNHSLLIISLLFLPFLSTAQTIEGPENQITALAIENIFNVIENDYFHPDPPRNPNSYKTYHPDSIYELFDRETFASKTSTGKELNALHRAELPQLRKVYQAEMKRWKFKKNLGKKACVVNSYKQKALDRYQNSVIPSSHSDYERLLIKKPLAPFTGAISTIPNTTDHLLINPSKENKDKYKYAITTYLTLSNVSLNDEQNQAALLVGTHYMLGGHQTGKGVSGFGLMLLFAKEKEEWKIIHRIGLWQE